MKSLFYICLLGGVIALFASERVRTTMFNVASARFSEVEFLFKSGNTAEIRQVNADNFDSTINESGRLVIVDFHNEEIGIEKNNKSDLDQAIAHLPPAVLVAKVQADRNLELIDRLQVQNIPTIRVYRDGQLLEEFKGRVDLDLFMKVVQQHLDNPDSKPHNNGYVGPLDADWMPKGVEEQPEESHMTPLNFDQE